MSNENLTDWNTITSEEAYRLSQAEFKGMVIQSLQDIRGSIAAVDKKVENVSTTMNGKIDKINLDNRIKGYINMAIGGLAGIAAGLIGGHIKIGGN